MRNKSFFFRSTIVVFLSVLFACQKEPEQLNDTPDDSLLKLYAGTSMGYKDGPVLEAQFQYPTLIAAGPDKSLYVVEHTGPFPRHILLGGSRIRRISPEGLVSTFYNLNTTDILKNVIRGIAVDKNGVVYISEGNQIKKISSNGSQATVVAGSGLTDQMRDGPALSASFFEPHGLAFDNNGCLYIMDTRNNAVRLFTGGKVTTLAGGNRDFNPESALSDKPKDGTGREAEFDYPKFISLDREGNAYVVGGDFPIVRKVALNGEVSAIPKGTLEYDPDYQNSLYGITAPHNGRLYYSGFLHHFPGDRFRFSIGSRNLSGGEITILESDEYDINFDEDYEDVDDFPNASERGLNYPTGTIIIDQRLYICNSGEHRIRFLELN